MQKIPFFGLSIMIITHSLAGYTPQLAVINCPVADLIGEPFAKHVLNRYKQIPLYATHDACPRVHQALYNEIVKIVDENECEYCVEISNAYFITEKSKQPQHRYWTLKKNCSLLDGEIKRCLPRPISFAKVKASVQQPIIVLTQPWHDATSGVSFSAGTRFVYLPDESDAEAITFLRYDYVKKMNVYRGIHHTQCRIEKQSTSPAQARQAYVNLIRCWITAHQSSFIPYVWGGCSYIYRYTGKFKQRKDPNTNAVYFSYHKSKRSPHPGFDCSGLILRATQIMGIPFFCKNSYTMAAQLQPVTEYTQIEVGDILWIPGHVMIVADLENNTVIEARGYPHGYGKLQETPLAEQFKGIANFKQLVTNLKAGKSLIRLNKEGTVVATIPHYKILKLY